MVRQRYSVFLLEKERDKISTEIKGWSVEEYATHIDEWRELKKRLTELNEDLGILKREQDETK